MKNLSKLLNLAAFSVAVAFLFNACESKEELYQQCYYSFFNDDNRIVKQRQKGDEQCLKLAKLEEKDENLEEAIIHYIRACEINTPDSACESLAAFAPKMKKLIKRDMSFKKCQTNTPDIPCVIVESITINQYDIEDIFAKLCQQGNQNACFEFKKAVLSSERFNRWDLSEGVLIDDFDKMCKENLPKACDERDKLVKKNVDDSLQEWRKHKDFDFYHISRLDKFCRWEGLNSQISQRACAGRDEIIDIHEKECNENNAKSCKVLTLAYYDFFHSGTYEYTPDERTYDSEYDKIYPPKFKKAAQKACDLGEISGCQYLAFFYYGYKPELNYTLARQYGKKVSLMLQNAHKRGDYLVAVDIAPLVIFAYEEAMTDDENKKQFILDYFKVACDDLQNDEHCMSFGRFYDGEFGMSELINQKKALHYYDKACELGSEVGCKRLGKIYLFGEIVGGKKVKKDIVKARHYFAKDCKNIGGFCSDACSDTDDTSCYLKQMSLKELGKIKEIRGKWEHYSDWE